MIKENVLLTNKSVFLFNDTTYCHLHVVQTGSGAHSASYSMGTVGSSLGVKRQGHKADHSPPTSAEVMKMWIYTSTFPYAFMA
jgi:hypothetical protein